MLQETHFRPNLSSKNGSAQISHAHQIVGGTGEGKDPVHFTDSTMTQLPQQGQSSSATQSILRSASSSFDSHHSQGDGSCARQSRSRHSVSSSVRHAVSPL